MCGRFAISTLPEVIRARFGYAEAPDFPPRYNIAPAQPVPIVRRWNGRRQFVLVRWGLLPSWVKDPKSFPLLFNARGEKILEKHSFRAAMQYRRCLFIADGFYEWRREGKTKQPYFIRRRDREPMAFAGVWETYADPSGGEIDTAAIVTVAANEELAAIHHRMPAILAPEDYARWLDPDVKAKDAAALLVPLPPGALEIDPVSTAVSRASFDGPGLIEPVSAVKPEQPAKPSPPSQAKLFPD
jgi:putative SOS response-associated peptidase YedK